MNDNRTFFRKAKQQTLGVKDIFSDVFRRHTREENARLFLAGTALTTPDEASMLAKWVKPYMFARIFIAGLGLMIVSMLLNNALTLPFIFTIGSYLVPVTVMFFIWEMNIPRNIAFASVLAIFLAGGVESLVFTTLLSLFSFGTEASARALSVGMIEEAAKLLAVMLWMRRGDKKYILSGMLVGAAVGAGFAAVESTGYAVIGGDWSISTMILRGLMAPGGHVTYAAITGGALAWAQGSEKLSLNHLKSPKLLGGYLFSALTHAFYDYCCFTGNLLFMLVGVVPVVGAYFLLKTGLNQVVDAAMGKNDDRITIALDHDFLDSLAEAAPAAPARQASELRLQGVRGSFAGRRFAMQPCIRLGRDPRRSNLVFPAGTAGVSGLHCEILLSGSRIYVKDMESTYGTYVNGLRLNPGQPAEIRPGDHICLGSAREELQVTLRGGGQL